MNKLSLVQSTVAALLAVASMQLSAQDRVGDFSLLDQDGYFHNMSWYDDHASIALLVQANDSDATAAALADFAALRDEFDAQGIQFFMINPMGRLNRADVQAKLADYGVAIDILLDDSRVVSQALGIDKTGEVLLFNPSSFRVDYRGSVAGAHAAIGEILAGQPVSNPLVAVQGDPVSYQMPSAVSYTSDVAPIIAENCASCHREGGIAPFAMDSHAMVRGWSPMIREVLMTKRMPPGQIDSHIGEFDNDMLLQDSEIQTILSWIAAGSPVDGSSDPLAALSWPTSKWAFGEPDYIIKIPSQQIPATGVLDYRYVSVPIDIDEDKWVRGSQYAAGDRTVLHHTLNSIVEPGEQRRRGFLGGGNPD
ncbi:MAG: redoxin domain-containing protein, partial [Gammaproteobacteria bacterium]